MIYVKPADKKKEAQLEYVTVHYNGAGREPSADVLVPKPVSRAVTVRVNGHPKDTFTILV